MSFCFRFLPAFVVAAHGLVYLNLARGVLPVFDDWSGRAWLLGGTITGEVLRKLTLALWFVAGLGFVATAALLAFAPSAEAAWRALAVAASVAGCASFAVFWDGRARRLFAQGVVGAAVSVTMLVAALAFPMLRVD